MKKIFYLCTIILSIKSFGQGFLHIYNYSSYDLTGRLFAASPTNCLPEVFTSYNVPAGAMVDIKSFNTSNLANPPIPVWAVRTSPTAGSAFPQTVPTGLLTTMGTLTRWEFYWFQTRDAGTWNATSDPEFRMGEPFAHNCGFDSVDYQIGVVTKAIWSYDPITNETTLIIKNI